MSTEQPPEETPAPEAPATETPATEPVAETTPDAAPEADAAPAPDATAADAAPAGDADAAPAGDADAASVTDGEADGADIAVAAAEEAPPAPPPFVPSGRIIATGKRKSSIARVIMEPGDGSITCNGRPLEELLGRRSLVQIARKPLAAVALEGTFSIKANVSGGGVSGQAGAISHGIARALVKADENFRPALKSEGLLTRDDRVKERKKAGLRGARAKPQFSKR